MERRDFIKLAGVAGLSLAAPSYSFAQSTPGADEPYEGLMVITINAGGGWDPTSLCDPKGSLGDTDPDPMNMYPRDSIIDAGGGLRIAPVSRPDSPREIERILTRFFSSGQLLVLNGVDCKTNSHDSGNRYTWSGNLSEGAPSFAAMVAANNAPLAPMAYVSNGGYDFTAGLVSRTRSGSTNALERIAYPHRIDVNDENRLYHTQATIDRIKAAQKARLDNQTVTSKLPQAKQAMNQLYAARAGTKVISRLTEFLPDELDNSGVRIRRQAQIALAAYRAGIAVSANLHMGGFDTHGNHDQNQIPRLEDIMLGMEYVMDEAERQGVANKVVVMVGSDFGRTPGYNDGLGKDHWPITSFLMMGAGIRGGRVIGATDDRHNPKMVVPGLLEVVEDETPGASRITPAHIHKEMRALVGIKPELEAQYPISVDTDLGLLA